MIPVINSITQIPTDQTVICIVPSDKIPVELKLSTTETEYLNRCFADSPDYVTINSYFKLTIIVKEKENLSNTAKLEELRKVSVKVLKELSVHKQLSVAIVSYCDTPGSVKAMTEGLILSKYKFAKYKSETDKEKNSLYPETIFIEESNSAFIPELTALCEAVYFARDKVNEPLNHLSAVQFAASISKFCGTTGLMVETLTKKRIEALKMGGLLAVNRGSNDPPTLSVIEWKPDKAVNKRPVILIGKGVVFDSGGLNLKPTNYIEDMKCDMAGGAAVSAVMYYLAKTRIPLYVMAFVPATDNRPGKDAYAPGDVITMYNGKTVEVLNTDAEGRLILADALSYADKFNPALVISVATLTGSAANTFGNKAIAVMGNANPDFTKLMSDSGDAVYERVGPLPFWDEYGEALKSDIADLKNIGGREGGAIVAGKFLENFTTSPYIHLDIAGTAMLKKQDHYRPKNGTGSAVRLLSEFLKRLSTTNVELIK